MKKFYFVLLVALLFSGCWALKIGYWDNWNEYTVKAGKHSSNMPKMVIQDSSIEFFFKVDASWYYNIPDEINGISKIAGIAIGDHHKNSARLGFICTEGVLWLYTYCYVDGVSPQQNPMYKSRIKILLPGEVYRVRIHYNSRYRKYNFFLNNEPMWSVDAGDAGGIKTVLTPYIGGTYTLPHDVKFELLMVK